MCTQKNSFKKERNIQVMFKNKNMFIFKTKINYKSDPIVHICIHSQLMIMKRELVLPNVHQSHLNDMSNVQLLVTTKPLKSCYAFYMYCCLIARI